MCAYTCARARVCVYVPFPPTDWQVNTKRSVSNDHGKPLLVSGYICSGHGDQLMLWPWWSACSWRQQMHLHIWQAMGSWRLCKLRYEEPIGNTGMCNQPGAAINQAVSLCVVGGCLPIWTSFARSYLAIKHYIFLPIVDGNQVLRNLPVLTGLQLSAKNNL